MPNVLQAVSDALVETVKAAAPSVVRVEARQRLAASGVVWSADGVIVTASHVVERDRDLHVGLPNGQRVPARLLGRDPGADLAVLRAEATGLSPAQWAEPDGLEPGSLALAVGRPGEQPLATLGILSVVDREWRTPQGGIVDYYVQSDTVMYPGFSGGALVDVAQRVVGVATSGLVNGLALALPAPTVRRGVEAVLQNKRLRQGYLGVTAQPVPLPEALRQHLGQDAGLLLIHVEPGSPADRGRLVQGDTLVTLDGQPLRSLSDLMRVLNGDKVDVPLTTRLVRAGQVRELPITLIERPA